MLLVVHGSLYPWQFDPSVAADAAWSRLWASAGWWTSLGDVAGNLVLFIPVGWLAAQAWPRMAGRAHAMRSPAIWMLGVGFALALQVLQFWVPARTPSLADVLWNAAGMALGQLAAALKARTTAAPAPPATGLAATSTATALLWLAIEWWPFLPTVDFQQIKNAFKPLLLTPHWQTRSFVEVALSVVVVAHIGRARRHRAAWLCALVAAAAVGKLFVHGQVFSLPHVAGWLGGLALAAVLFWRIDARQAGLLALGLALAFFTFEELRPFAWSSRASDFGWIPFVASLRGSMVANVLALTWQLFWIGSIMVIGQALGWRTGVLAIALAVWALLLEWQQCWLPGRVADITPALLPLLWWMVLPLLAAEPGEGPEIKHSRRGRAACATVRS